MIKQVFAQIWQLDDYQKVWRVHFFNKCNIEKVCQTSYFILESNFTRITSPSRFTIPSFCFSSETIPEKGQRHDVDLMHSVTCIVAVLMYSICFVHASTFLLPFFSHPSFVLQLFFLFPVLNYCPGRFMGHVGLRSWFTPVFFAITLTIGRTQL